MSASSTDPDLAPARSRSSRSSWKWLLRLVAGAFVVWLLARGASQAPLEGIRRAPAPLLAACVVAYWCGQCLSARRWQILLNALASDPEDGASVPRPSFISWRECLSWYAAGMFWNLWMPTGLGGDAARSLLSGRRARDGARGALSVVLDRILGLGSLLLLALAALVADTTLGHAAVAQGSVRQARHVLLACALAGAVVLAMAWMLIAWHARRSRAQVGRNSAPEMSDPGSPSDDAGTKSETESGARSWGERVSRALGSGLNLLSSGVGWRRAGVLVPVLALSLSVQAIQIGINVALARAVGLPLEPASMAWVAPVLALSAVVPLGIGGLGAREAGAVALLGGAFGSGDVLAWSLLWQAVVWLSSLLGAPAAWRWRHLNAPGAEASSAPST